MNLLQILDLALITLALTSILLTLISFAIYKYRQLPKSPHGGGEGQTTVLEGVYFSRFMPVVAASDGSLLGDPTTKTQSKVRRNAQFYIIISGVVIASILLQGLVSRYRTKKEHTRIAERYRKLYEKGLLRNYDFSFQPTEGALEETILPSQRARHERSLSLLRERKVYFFEPQHPDAPVVPIQKGSRTSWRDLLKNWGVPFTEITKAESALPGSIVIVAQSRALSDPDRELLESALKHGASVLATGAVGILNGRGEPANLDWEDRVFGIRLIKNSNKDFFFPTSFKADGAPQWELPAGTMLPWLPADNEFEATPTSGTSAAFETTYRGKLNKDGLNWITRAQLKEYLPNGVSAPGRPFGRTAWLAFEPGNWTDFSNAEKFYAQEALASILIWLEARPSARLTSWKDGAKIPVVFSVDCEDHFELVDHFINLFKDEKFPATFSLASQFFQRYPKIVNDINPNMELISHSENHDIFENQVSEKQFDRVQTSRIEIEEISEQRVGGFHPPLDKYDANTINSVVQNRLDYFLGDGRFQRYAPIWIAKGKLLFFPRVAFDDFAILKRKDLIGSDDIERVILEDFEQSLAFNGEFLFNSHTHLFGQSSYQEPLRNVLRAVTKQPGIWKTNFGELSQWWKLRSGVEIKIKNSDVSAQRLQIQIKNTSIQEVQGAMLELSLPSSKSISKIELNPTLEGAFKPILDAPNRIKLGTLAGSSEQMIEVILN